MALSPSYPSLRKPPASQASLTVGQFRSVPVLYDASKRQFLATVAGKTFRRASQRDLERILQQVLDSRQRAIRLLSDGACPEVVRVVFVHEKSHRATILCDGRHRQQELVVVGLSELRAYSETAYQEVVALHQAMEEAQEAFWDRLRRLSGFVGQSVAEEEESEEEAASGESESPEGDVATSQDGSPLPEEEPLDDTDPFAEPSNYGRKDPTEVNVHVGKQ